MLPVHVYITGPLPLYVIVLHCLVFFIPQDVLQKIIIYTLQCICDFFQNLDIIFTSFVKLVLKVTNR